jgi:DNA-binding NarL/FixJ family response regulator
MSERGVPLSGRGPPGGAERERTQITVLVADDQPLMRSALRSCLAAESDLEVVGEAVDGRDAIERAERLRPDVVLMDVRMPHLDGVAATRQLVRANGGRPMKVLMLTTFDLDEYIVDALRAGASGFLLKDATPEALVHAVRVVAAGDALLAPTVTRRLLDRYAHHLPAATADLERLLGDLTDRELTVLKLVARGLSNAEIGRVLNLAVSSVKTHLSHLLAKRGMSDRVQLVVLAYESGLVRPGTGPAPEPRRPAG